MRLANGDRLGPYEIVVAAGAGGMGEVYRARDTRLDREVAIKVLPSALSGDADRLRRFEQEARLLGALNHPNILAIFDIGADAGVHYLVSEFLEGQTLRERIDERGLPSRKATDYALQIARALAAAHGKGIIHRDLKPENIFITRDDHVKVLDFGLAKHARAASADALGATATEVHTAVGVVMGTAGYMAPEQVRGTAIDYRADIFSFGAILYEMLSGARAFQGDSTVETMNAILKEEPPDLSESKLVSSPGLERIIRRCLEKVPERRFQSASDLAFAIEALSGISGTSSAQKTVALAPARRWVRAVLATAAVIAVGAAGFALATALKKDSQASFRQLVFCPGYISSARFTPDGDNIVYGAAWNGKPIEIFSTRLSGGESRSLGLPPADVLGVSTTGDMAIGLGRHHFFQWLMTGTLGRASLSGGAPRPLLDDVCDADISADGRQFAIVRCSGSEQTLEFPAGKVLFRTSGWIDHPRISPNGHELAFLEHPVGGDDRGYVALADTSSGKVTRLAGEFSAEKGLAWSAGGEIWFSASIASEPNALRAVTLSGRQRVVFAAPANLWLQDIGPKGRVLLANQRQSSDIAVRGPSQKTDQIIDLEGEDNSITGISDDGSQIAVTNSGSSTGVDYEAELVSTAAPAPVRLGDGDPCGISPDGKWVLSFLPTSPAKFTVYPTGTGEARSFDIHPVSNTGIYCTWTRDGTKAAFTGAEPGKAPRAYLLDVNAGKARPVTPEGTTGAWLSPDGSRIVTQAGQRFMIYPVADGEPKPVIGLSSAEIPLQWHESSRKLFVWDRKFPAHIVLLDPATGERKEWLTIQPPDPAGLLYATLFITPDGKYYAYRYRRVLTNLFVAQGLR